MEIMCQSRKVLYILYLGLSTLNNEKINKNLFVFLWKCRTYFKDYYYLTLKLCCELYLSKKSLKNHLK